jgi:hypothetical protein
MSSIKTYVRASRAVRLRFARGIAMRTRLHSQVTQTVWSYIRRS